MNYDAIVAREQEIIRKAREMVAANSPELPKLIERNNQAIAHFHGIIETAEVELKKVDDAAEATWQKWCIADRATIAPGEIGCCTSRGEASIDRSYRDQKYKEHERARSQAQMQLRLHTKVAKIFKYQTIGAK